MQAVISAISISMTKKMRWVNSFGLLFLSLWMPLLALDIDQCQQVLGMEEMRIPDSAITASSSKSDLFAPSNARIRTELGGGAWCPKQQIEKDVYEFLQIDLGELKVIRLVETQGRFGNGQGQEFTEQYILEYQREARGRWFRYKNKYGAEVIQGNINTYIGEIRVLTPPVVARQVRFVPVSDHPQSVCLRVEMFGCPWTDGAVAYDVPQGEKRGTDIDLTDLTYDGDLHHHRLVGGMGQLMDGTEGQTNFRHNPEGLGIRGYEWLGWRNDSFITKPVEIVVKFDAVRNFTSVRLHCNNMFTKEVRVFKKAVISFSIGGKYYLGETIEFVYMRDMLIEYARPVSIGLQHRIGRYMKIQLHFDSRWMMISEILTESVYANGNFTEEPAPTTIPPSTTTTTAASTTLSGVIQVNLDVTKNGSAGKLPNRPGHITNNQPGPHPDHNSNTGAISNTVNSDSTGNQDNNKDGVISLNKEPHINPGYTPVNKEITTPESVIHPVDSGSDGSLDNEVIGIIIGVLATLTVLLLVIMILFIVRQRRKKYNQNKNNKSIDSYGHVTLDLHAPSTSSINGRFSNGNLYNNVATSDMESDREANSVWNKLEALGICTDGMQGRRLPEPPQTACSTGTSGASGAYAVCGDLAANPSQLMAAHSSPVHASTLPAIYSQTFNRDNIVTPSIQGVSGGNVYGIQPNTTTDFLWSDDLQVMEFPRDNLKFLEKLGEGQFGEVHLCEALRIVDFLGEDFLVNRTGNSSKALNMRVAVKVLRTNADEGARYDFNREVKIMSRIKDPNIVRVLGVCTLDEPWCVIVEYMKYGDLNEYLKKHVPEGTVSKWKGAKQLSYGCLIYMASQIASGMKYLETLNMVHRDLACRNCLVGYAYTIKISDFGMSRSLYHTDYYRIEGKAVLPIRWMAWESVLLGKFSTKSDVWSFGVCLWEILSFAREQPFDNMTDDQVIENLGLYYRGGGGQLELPQPVHSPKEIYDLMRECWNRDEQARPTFKEVHMFLNRKNMGYDPKKEKLYQTTNFHSHKSLPHANV